MSKPLTVSVTRAEAQQLLSYINGRDEGNDAGWFYPPRADFERRHASLKAMFERILLAPVTKAGES